MVALTMYTLLCNRTLEFFHLQTEPLYPLNNNSPFPSSPAPGPRHPHFCFSEQLLSMPHLSGTMKYLAFCGRFISLEYCPQGPSMFLA